jgi:adenine-specific DNA-methyltransferase
MLARNLLRQDGLILVSIDDNEIATLRLVLAEVFGEENFLASLVWDRGHSQQQGQFKEYHEYVLAFARNRSKLAGFKDPSGGEVLAGAIKRPSKANPISEFRFPAGIRVQAANGTEFSGTWGTAETTTLVDGRFRVRNGATTEPMTLAAAWTQKGQMQAFYYSDGDVFDTRGQKVLEFFFSSTGKLKYRKERSALTPPTVQRWGTQGSASGALESVLGSGIFDLPKPVRMIKDFVAWATEGNDLVLDFFAGSGTTAQAVAEQNAEDGGRRRVITVNIPQETAPFSEARKAGYKTVSAITESRLRKLTEIFDDAAEGLRIFRLGPSNFRVPDVESGELNLAESTLARVDNDWQSVAAEVLLKEGVALNEPWERHHVNGSEIIVAKGVAVVLSEKIDDALVAHVLALSARVVVFLEDGFAGADALKANTITNAKNARATLKTV